MKNILEWRGSLHGRPRGLEFTLRGSLTYPKGEVHYPLRVMEVPLKGKLRCRRFDIGLFLDGSLQHGFGEDAESTERPEEKLIFNI